MQYLFSVILIVFAFAFVLVSHKFGYGLMDAGGMVSLAEQWTTVPPQHICKSQEIAEERCVLENVFFCYFEVCHTSTYAPAITTMSTKKKNVIQNQTGLLSLKAIISTLDEHFYYWYAR